MSPAEICNLAISHLGVGKPIADLTDRSEEARACSTFYEVDRDLVLERIDWPFAAKYGTLTVVEEDPNDDWAYSYVYPTDCLKMRRILSGQRQDTDDSRIPFELAHDDDDVRRVFTDEEDAVAKYTKRVTATDYFSMSFIEALSWKIAASIAPRLAGAKAGAQATALQMYEATLNRAAVHAGNESPLERQAESEFIRGR